MGIEYLDLVLGKSEERVSPSVNLLILVIQNYCTFEIKFSRSSLV